MFCPNSSKEKPDESKICSFCGGKITSAKKRRNSNLKIILPIVIVLFLLFASFAVYQVIKTHTGTNQKQEVPASNSTNNEQKTLVLIPYRKGNKWGYCDRDKKIVIKPVYDDANPFSEDLAAVKINGKWGCIDKKGKMIIQTVYDDIRPFYDGLAAVTVDDKWGYIDTKGNIVIKPIYELTEDFSEGFAWVKINGKFGSINTKGKMVIPAIYDSAKYYANIFQNGLASVYYNPPMSTIQATFCGYIDKNGTQYWEN